MHPRMISATKTKAKTITPNRLTVLRHGGIYGAPLMIALGIQYMKAALQRPHKKSSGNRKAPWEHRPTSSRPIVTFACRLPQTMQRGVTCNLPGYRLASGRRGACAGTSIRRRPPLLQRARKLRRNRQTRWM
ncbi:unnamed protein product, partial [Iphiclides podalirius]